ncbi:MAG: M23 family metallopeptidase [Elusimicrobia bacterium]|nr:M23 family metallopeptidase [Elusimicrobiota bacterium]
MILKLIRTVQRYLSRHVTVLVIPHTELPLLKGRFSLSFILAAVAFWSVLTIWAGFSIGRHADYYVTKADNMVLRAKMNYMASEIGKSREFLEIARSTDRQIRRLLGMKTPASQGPASEEALGGPSSADRAGLMKLLSSNAAQMSESAIRRSVSEIEQESRQRLASFQEIAWFIANQRSLLHSTPSIWPALGNVTSPFGYRFSPIRRASAENDDTQFHSGIDIANRGGTPLAATADGIVRFAGWSGGYGLMVVIDHGYGFSTLYAHTSKTFVRAGERVKRKQVIAAMGSTGRTTGSHLHYEVWSHSRPVNPLKYLHVQPSAIADIAELR